jgi:hypothetical protein
VKQWQRIRVIMANSIVLLIGLSAIGWQVFRNIAYGQPYAWPILLFTAVMVVVSLGLLTYALRTPPMDR